MGPPVRNARDERDRHWSLYGESHSPGVPIAMFACVLLPSSGCLIECFPANWSDLNATTPILDCQSPGVDRDPGRRPGRTKKPVIPLGERHVFSGAGAIVVAVINTVYGQGARRAYWLGFAICGGVYLAICSLPGIREAVCTRLATEAVLDFLYPHLAPASTVAPTVSGVGPPATGTIQYLINPVSPYVAFNFGNPVVPPLPPLTPRWDAWTQPDRTVGSGYLIGTVQLSSSEAYRQIGHAMSALLLAVLGATFARHRYRASFASSQVPTNQ